MKKLSLLLAILMMLSCCSAFAEEPAGPTEAELLAQPCNFAMIEADGAQPRLTYIDGLTTILEVDGLQFKDHNKNGTLEVYEDWRVDAETRTQDLISQMTVREKIAQMQHPTFVPKANGKVPSYLEKWSTTENIGLVLVRELDSVKNAAKTMNQVQEWAEASRLGVPIIVSMDSVHGTSYVYGATVTPHNLGLAATRNVELVSKLADIARQEHIAIGTRMTLSPEADIATEPRWGRTMETFGEDADLVTEMVVAQVVGFQNGTEGLNEDSIMACMKHFPGSGPQMDGIDMAPIVSDEETLQYHLQPYYAALEVNVASIMPYYSSPIYLDMFTAALGSEAILQDLLREEMDPKAPVYMSYKTHADNDSMYNTPNTWSIYCCGKVFKYLKSIGGLEEMFKRNLEKATILYGFLDSSKMFKATARPEDRSLMNVCFNTGSDELDAEVVAASKKAGFDNLKGHRSTGGLRASIYNAMPKEGVEALVAFLKDFEENHK